MGAMFPLPLKQALYVAKWEETWGDCELPWVWELYLHYYSSGECGMNHDNTLIARWCVDSQTGERCLVDLINNVIVCRGLKPPSLWKRVLRKINEIKEKLYEII